MNWACSACSTGRKLRGKKKLEICKLAVYARFTGGNSIEKISILNSNRVKRVVIIKIKNTVLQSLNISKTHLGNFHIFRSEDKRAKC